MKPIFSNRSELKCVTTKRMAKPNRKEAKHLQNFYVNTERRMTTRMQVKTKKHRHNNRELSKEDGKVEKRVKLVTKTLNSERLYLTGQ